jgi:hypothetical protein
MTGNFDWALKEPILVTALDDGNRYHVARINESGDLDISFSQDGKQMLFDGEFIDVGDDFIQYVSILDEYYEQGGEPNKTIRQEPFEEQ